MCGNERREDSISNRPVPDPPEQKEDCDYDSGQLEDGDLVPLLSHATKACSTSLERGRQVGEEFIL